MSEAKPSIAELYESGGLDMWLVNKIAHNELDKRKGPLFNSVYALASEYIDAYIDDHPEVIETYTDMLDSELTATDFEGGRISLSSCSVPPLPAARHHTPVVILKISAMRFHHEPSTKSMSSAWPR